jgi:hypothetical protein
VQKTRFSVTLGQRAQPNSAGARWLFTYAQLENFATIMAKPEYVVGTFGAPFQS